MFYYVVNSFITRQPPRRSLLLRKSVKYFGAKLSPPRRTLQQKCLPWGKKLRVQPPPAREQTLLTFGNMRIARKMKRFFIPPDLIFLVAIWEKLFNNVKEETEKCPTISRQFLPENCAYTWVMETSITSARFCTSRELTLYRDGENSGIFSM